MTDKEAMKLALDALETEVSIDWTNNDEFNASAEKMHEAITAINEALAQPAPAQKPVALRDALSGALSGAYICSRVWSAWRVGTMTEDDFQLADECDELLDELVAAVAFATPPAAQRPWVGLTDDELLDIADMAYANDLELLKNLQAKLKEKNHAKAITAALAMSHPIVVETINVLAEMSQRLQDENDELKAALAAEREACAQVCAALYKKCEDDLANVAVGEDDPEIPNWFDCKLAIEARNET